MCLIIFILIPALIGLGVVMGLAHEERSIGLVFPVGYVVMLLAFELVTLPVLFFTKYDNFKYVIALYSPVLIALAAYGAYKTYQKAGSLSGIMPLLRSMSSRYTVYSEHETAPGTNKILGFLMGSNKLDTIIVWVLAAGVLLYMLIMAETHVIFDGDDAYYVVQSLITQQNGSMYSIQPYTGVASPIDMRHAMAVFTMWITYAGKVTGIHTTILCHSVLPLVLIPLTVITYMELGLRLLKKKEDMLPYFVLITELLILFGRTSMYTSEKFLLSRTWQGKSLAANLLIPMVVLVLFIHLRKSNKMSWIMLLVMDTVAGIFSSLAVMQVSILIGIGGLWYGIKNKSLKDMIRVWLCLIPGLLYILLYLYFTYIAWTP